MRHLKPVCVTEIDIISISVTTEKYCHFKLPVAIFWPALPLLYCRFTFIVYSINELLHTYINCLLIHFLNLCILTVNTGLAVGLSLGLFFLFCFIAVPLIIVCVIVYCARRNRRRTVVYTRIVATAPPSVGTTVVTSGQNTNANPPAATSGAIYPAQQYPTVVAPPGHPIQQPGTTYPADPPPVPQVCKYRVGHYAP